MSKCFKVGDYPAGTTLICTEDFFNDSEIFTKGKTYMVNYKGELVDNDGDYNRSSLSTFEAVLEEKTS